MKILITLCMLMVSTLSFASNDINATRSNLVETQLTDYQVVAPLAERDNLVEVNYDRIYVKNRCYKTVQLAVISLDLEGDWIVRAWMNVSPGETAYVADTQNASFYFYAESTDGQMQWSGDNYFTIQGGQFGFIQRYTNIEGWGTYTQGLTCN